MNPQKKTCTCKRGVNRATVYEKAAADVKPPAAPKPKTKRK